MTPLHNAMPTVTGHDGVHEVKPCRLIQGVAALSAQLVLLCVVVSVLVIKRHRERPRRPWNIWSLDVSKQAFSGGAGHMCGMAIAILAHRHSHASSPCGWYLVVYGLDTTVGITVALSLHRAANMLVRHYHFARQRQIYSSGTKGSDDHSGPGDNSSGGHCEEDERNTSQGFPNPWWRALVEIGNYGEPPCMYRWAIQVALWVSCVVCARVVVATVVILGIPFFIQFTEALEKRFEGHPDLLLYFVMVGVPMVLNIMQAWVQDQFLKWKHRGVVRLRRGTDEDAGKVVGPADSSASQLIKHQRKAGVP